MFVVFIALVFVAISQSSAPSMLEQSEYLSFEATPLICKLECEEVGL